MVRLKNFWTEITTTRSAGTSQESSSIGEGSFTYEEALSIDEALSSLNGDSIFTSNSGVDAIKDDRSRKPIAQFLPPIMLSDGDSKFKYETSSDGSSFDGVLGIHPTLEKSFKKKAEPTKSNEKDAVAAMFAGSKADPVIWVDKKRKKSSFIFGAPRAIRVVLVLSILVILFASLVIILVYMSQPKDNDDINEISSLTVDERGQFLSSNQTPSPAGSTTFGSGPGATPSPIGSRSGPIPSPAPTSSTSGTTPAPNISAGTSDQNTPAPNASPITTPAPTSSGSATTLAPNGSVGTSDSETPAPNASPVTTNPAPDSFSGNSATPAPNGLSPTVPSTPAPTFSGTATGSTGGATNTPTLAPNSTGASASPTSAPVKFKEKKKGVDVPTMSPTTLAPDATGSPTALPTAKVIKRDKSQAPTLGRRDRNRRQRRHRRA